MPLIIPIFLMNRGCPHHCLFCNERLTAGNRPDKITETAFTETVRAHLDSAPLRSGPVQIAFYGGTFTGMERDDQQRLLALAAPFLREGSVDGIRISTRPDGIDAEGLYLLQTSGVTTVELGAQSFDNEVLLRSRRGHTKADTVQALHLLKDWRFKTGIHLMAGLPGDNPERFAETVKEAIALRPDMVRIHPTLVLRDTALAEALRNGNYLPLSMADAVNLCKNALKKLTAAGIPVIRLGLQTTRELEEPGAVVAGPFHPAFRSLVESALFLEMAEMLLVAASVKKGGITFCVAPADVSNFLGLRRGNIAAIEERFNLNGIRVAADPFLTRGTLILKGGNRKLQTDGSGRIMELQKEGLHADTGRGIIPSGILKGMIPEPGMSSSGIMGTPCSKVSP